MRKLCRKKTSYEGGIASSVAWRDGGRCGLEVDSLDRLLQVVAVAHEVGKVLLRDLGFDPEFARLFFLLLQLLDVALQTDANVVCGALEGAADLRADAEGVLVGVVDG